MPSNRACLGDPLSGDCLELRCDEAFAVLGRGHHIYADVGLPGSDTPPTYCQVIGVDYKGSRATLHLATNGGRKTMLASRDSIVPSGIFVTSKEASLFNLIRDNRSLELSARRMSRARLDEALGV